jgi:DedD protein
MKNIASNSNNKMRKYLILGGGVFILFVIGIVVSKFLFSSPQKNKTSVILPPDIEQNQKAKNNVNDNNPNNNVNYVNDIPVENANVADNNNNPNTFQKPTTQNQPQPALEVDNTKVEKKVTKAKPVKEEKTVKKVVKKTKPKTIKKPTVTKGANYYLQVAAVTRGNPSKKFLELITKNGFKYKIVEVNVKGMKVKRVLVGPFTYSELKKALPKVKAKISSSAFVKRIK